MARKPHPIKEIEAAVRYAEENGWTWIKASGHAWGILRCPWNDKECRCGEFCQASIWSTPRSGENHANQLRRVIDRCMHVMAAREAEPKEKEGKK